MHEEEFIREILGNPKDDVARQVYADWLEEQGDPVASAKAEYLRTTVELADRPAEEKNWGGSCCAGWPQDWTNPG